VGRNWHADCGTLISTSTIPRISGTITNNSSTNIKEIELAVFVLDGNQNVVAASRSFVENLIRKSTQDFVFTWPKPFDLGVESCTAPLDVVLALDRSGSMRSEGLFPPEPFTTVVNTAKNFVKNLKTDDQVSIVTFGNLSKIENNLSLDKQSVITSIENLSLSTTTQENTNIHAGLQDALTELTSGVARSSSKKAIIFLTDGLPTLPVDPNNPDFPTLSAQQTAETIKNSNIEIYTVGLGKNVSDGFLKSISTKDSYYFLSPTKETLSTVYANIASNLCQKKPNVINVIYK
jgi:Mg-chelatase subunit ChlD